MSKLLVTGRKKLDGEVEVQGAKNSALPIIAASILTKGENLIHNCPSLSDVDASVNILRYLGCAVTRCDKTLLVKCDDINRFDVPVELMRKTRSSIVFSVQSLHEREGREFRSPADVKSVQDRLICISIHFGKWGRIFVKSTAILNVAFQTDFAEQG